MVTPTLERVLPRPCIRSHMSPEILLEGRVSKAADVYAFGITLWELYTGGQPYKGAGEGAACLCMCVCVRAYAHARV